MKKQPFFAQMVAARKLEASFVADGNATVNSLKWQQV